MSHLTPSWSVPPWRHARYPWTAVRAQTVSSSELSLDHNTAPLHDNRVWRSWNLLDFAVSKILNPFSVCQCGGRGVLKEEGWAWAEEKTMATVVIHLEVKLVFNGTHCVWTVVLGLYFVLAGVVTFLKSWFSLNHLNCVHSCSYRKRILHQNTGAGL